MLFNSFEFLIFFPVATILFFLLPHRFRWLMLLIASCIFYCYFIPAYLLILIFTILVDYFAGILIQNSHNNKRWWLICSIAANVGLLAMFKYFNFFVSNFNTAFGTAAPLLNIVLPVGLSFHTFQAMSYTIEVFKGKVKAERNIGFYALYVLFYPQLVAGPIERPQNILPQIRSKQYFNAENLLVGLRLMTWGFFKKLVIADRLAMYVDIVYRDPADYPALKVMMTIFFFSIQIYCDFSGYTDIARGAAKIMGFDLMINFNRPFFAKTIKEFWQRWHISLSSWFRDYVYIPMGGNKKGTAKRIIFLSIVFLLSGFWHGAGWNFILWGALHALFFIIGVLFFKSSIKIKRYGLVSFLQILLINFLVAYAFVFFRNASVTKAWDVIKASFNFSRHRHFSFDIAGKYGLAGMGNYTMMALLAYIAFMFFYEWKTDASLKKMNQYPVLDACWFAVVVVSIFFWGVFTNETFIYFQF